MWHAYIWPELHQQFHNSCIIGQYAVRPAFDFSSNARMEIANGIAHYHKVSVYANICQLTFGISGGKPSGWDFAMEPCTGEVRATQVGHLRQNMIFPPPGCITARPRYGLNLLFDVLLCSLRLQINAK